MPDALVYDTTPNEIVDPADIQICEILGQTLLSHYPQHRWHVEAIHKQGAVKIALDNYHMDGNQRYGFFANVKGLVTYDMLRDLAIKAGGELLERAYISRDTGNRTQDRVDRS